MYYSPVFGIGNCNVTNHFDPSETLVNSIQLFKLTLFIYLLSVFIFVRKTVTLCCWITKEHLLVNRGKAKYHLDLSMAELVLSQTSLFCASVEPLNYLFALVLFCFVSFGCMNKIWLGWILIYCVLLVLTCGSFSSSPLHYILKA